MTTSALPVLSSESGLSKYIEEVNKFPYLTQEEELDLANKWVTLKDVEAAHKLVTSHLRLVVKVAMNFKGYGLPVQDLISEGNMGLMHAVKKFDPSKGFRLSTYAMWWIRAQIQEYVLRSWSLVKIGTTAAQKKLFFNLKKLRNRLEKVDDNALAPEDISAIASELKVSDKDVAEMDMRLAHHDQSLHTPMSHTEGESREMIDYLEEDSEDQETLVLEHQDVSHKKDLMAKAFAQLNEREQAIITERRLKDDQATLEELSQRFGISRERVRQVEARALEKMQAFVADLQS